MTIGLLGEAAEYLATLAEEDERARELSQRLRLLAEGIEESWPRSALSETVEWTDPDTGAAVVAHRRDEGWELARFAPGEDEPITGTRVRSLWKAVRYADSWLR